MDLLGRARMEEWSTLLKKSVSQAKFDQSYSIITVFICRGFLPWKVYLLQAQEKWSCNGWSLPRRTASMKPKSCCLPSFSLWRDTVAYGNGSPSCCSLWIHWSFTPGTSCSINTKCSIPENYVSLHSFRVFHPNPFQSFSTDLHEEFSKEFCSIWIRFGSITTGFKSDRTMSNIYHATQLMMTSEALVLLLQARYSILQLT